MGSFPMMGGSGSKGRKSGTAFLDETEILILDALKETYTHFLLVSQQ